MRGKKLTQSNILELCFFPVSRVLKYFRFILMTSLKLFTKNQLMHFHQFMCLKSHLTQEDCCCGLNLFWCGCWCAKTMGNHIYSQSFLGGRVIKNLPVNAGDRRHWFTPWIRKILWSRKWQSTPIFLLEIFMDRVTWWATVRGVSKS